MRTRPGQKRQSDAQEVTHHIEGADEQLSQRKQSIFDALRKLTAGPAADDWTIAAGPPAHEHSLRKGRQAAHQDAKRRN